MHANTMRCDRMEVVLNNTGIMECRNTLWKDDQSSRGAYAPKPYKVLPWRLSA